MSHPSVTLLRLVQRNALNDLLPAIKSALETPVFLPVATYNRSNGKLVFNPCMDLFAQCLNALGKLYGPIGTKGRAPHHPSVQAHLDFLIHTIVKWIIEVFPQILDMPCAVGSDVENLVAHFYKHLYHILSIPEALTLFGESSFVEDSTKVLERAFGKYDGRPWSIIRCVVTHLISTSNKKACFDLRIALRSQSKRLFMNPLGILRAATEFDIPIDDVFVDRSLVQISTICSIDKEFQDTLRHRLASKTLVELLHMFIDDPPTQFDGISECLLTLGHVVVDVNSPEPFPLRQALKFGLLEALATLVKVWGHDSGSFDTTSLHDLLRDLLYCVRTHQGILSSKIFRALEKIAEENMDGLGAGHMRELKVREGMSEISQCWVKFVTALSEVGKLDPETRQVKLFCMNPSCKDPCIPVKRAKRCTVCSIIIVCSKVCGRALYESGVHTHNPTLVPVETESAA